MMKHLILIFGLVLLMEGCKKENSYEFYPYANNDLNDTAWYKAIPIRARVRQLDSIFAIKPKEDSIDVTTGGLLKFGDSLEISFPPNFCTGGSVPVTGKVKVEMIHLKQKGDIIRADKPTMSYGSLLVTGGAVKIRVTYNNIELQLSPNKMINVSIFNKFSTTSLSNDMRVFYGKEDAYPSTAAQTFTWLPWADSPYNRVFPVTAQPGSNPLDGYRFLSNRFGWVNCDYFSDSSQPRTRVSVLLPLNFTNANTNVFAVVKSPDVVAQMYGDPQARSFVLPNMYVGKVVTFISLSYINNTLYFDSKKVTVTSNMILRLNPVQTTKQNIETVLDGL